MGEQGHLSGKVLEEKYLLGDLLGKGGFGEVYSARHLLLNRPQAIKMLLERHIRKPAFRERFLHEAHTLATLDHPHIVHIDDFILDEQETNAYLIMPLVLGGTFQDLLRKCRKPLSIEQVTYYLEQICKALDYAHHQDVVHLDLKPQNLLIHTDGRLLLSDFGLAHLIKQGVIEGGSSLSHGTPHYMAPEHSRGKPGKYSDIYALGIILYEMLAGRRPFEGPIPETIMFKHATEPPPPLRLARPELPPEVEKVILRVLSKQPRQRYQTAGELLEAFQEALESQQHRKHLEIERQRQQEEERRLQQEQMQTDLRLKAEMLLRQEEEAHRQALEQAHKGAEKHTHQLLEQQKQQFEEILARVDAAGNKLLLEEQQERIAEEEHARKEIADHKQLLQDLQKRLTEEEDAHNKLAQQVHGKALKVRWSDGLNLLGRSNSYKAYKRLLNRKNLLRLLMVFLIILGSSAYFLHSLGANQAAINYANATATDEARILATAAIYATVTVEAKALATSIPQETITTATNAYNTFVATNGVMFGFDAQHTHFNPYEQILSTTDVSKLVLDWTASLKNDNGSSGGWPISGSPIVDNNYVYTAGSADGDSGAKLHVFNAKTGNAFWTSLPALDVISSPALANGIVYLCSSQESSDPTQGDLEVFNAKAGVPLWTAHIGESFDCAPTIVDDVVYVASANNLYAFSAKTGTLLWTVKTSDYSGSGLGSPPDLPRPTTGSPAVENGVIYIGSGDGKLYAIDAKTGTPLWTTSVNSIYSSPAVANGTVYVGSDDGRLYAIDAKIGTILWSTATGGAVESSPAVANGTVYVGSDDGRLYAIDAKTGTTLWVVSLCACHYIESSPTVVNGIIFIGSYNGKLYAFDAKTGTMLWSFTTGDTIYSSPTVANGVIYVSSWGDKLYAFHLPGLP